MSYQTPNTRIANRPQALDIATAMLLCAILVPPYYANWRFGQGLFLVDVLELLLMFLALAICFSRKPRAAPMIISSLFGILFLVHLGWAIASENLLPALSHARWFLPLVVANAVLMAKLRLSRRTAAFIIATAVSLSSLIAISVHLLGSDVVTLLAGDITQTEVVRDEGRMYWYTSSASLCVPLILSVTGKRLVAWTAVVVTAVGVILTMNRSMMLSYLLILVAVMVVSKRSGLMRDAIFVAIATIGILFATWAAGLLPERALHTFQTRFSATPEELDRALLGTRVDLYQQYQQRIATSGILGQGLGHPAAEAHSAERQAPFTTDISLLTIWIPLGIPGLICLLAFVVTLFRLLRTESCEPLRTQCSILLMVAGIASLNVDLWTRNVFVIAAAFLAASTAGSNDNSRIKQIRCVSDV